MEKYKSRLAQIEKEYCWSPMPKHTIARKGDKPVKSLLSEKEKKGNIDILEDFVTWAKDYLEIKSKVKIIASSNKKKVKEIHALGYFSPSTSEIWVYVWERNTADVLRTIGHELVHLKQKENGIDIDGSTGSQDENEANSLAGVLLRIYGKKNPDIY